jgi:hypothetical protein
MHATPSRRFVVPEFKLIPEELPSSGRGGKGAVYNEMIEQFLKMKNPCTRVQYDRKPATIYQQLRNAVRNNDRFSVVKICRRRQNVYICLKDSIK